MNDFARKLLLNKLSDIRCRRTLVLGFVLGAIAGSILGISYFDFGVTDHKIHKISADGVLSPL